MKQEIVFYVDTGLLCRISEYLHLYYLSFYLFLVRFLKCIGAKIRKYFLLFTICIVIYFLRLTKKKEINTKAQKTNKNCSESLLTPTFVTISYLKSFNMQRTCFK